MEKLLGDMSGSFEVDTATSNAICKINGEIVPCEGIFNILGGALGGIALFVIFLVFLAVVVLMLVSAWKVFTKAGKPGWAVIIPIYNLVVMLQIAKLPIWTVVLFFVPVVNAIWAIYMTSRVAHLFGKGGGFTLGMIVLPFIFYPILAFGKSVYTDKEVPVIPQ